MTHAASRRRAGGAWKLPGVALVVVAAAVLIGWISRSIVIDFLSWWPVWLVLAGVTFWAGDRKLGRVRLSGLVAIASTVMVGLFVVGHLQGWPILPSSSDDLVGVNDTDIQTASVSAEVEGDLRVAPGAGGALYTVTPIRWGGKVGVPSAVERLQGDVVSIALAAADEPGWYMFAGWYLDLSPGPSWSLSLSGAIDADLTQLKVDNLQIDGEGTLSLGVVTQGTPVAISGDFVISVPKDQAVRVIGPAEVPENWIHNVAGTTAPVDGQGWVISVPEGSILQIKSR